MTCAAESPELTVDRHIQAYLGFTLTVPSFKYPDSLYVYHNKGKPLKITSTIKVEGDYPVFLELVRLKNAQKNHHNLIHFNLIQAYTLLKTMNLK